jgi:5-carboxymethyl-2-hydroxymuconate isomerase
MQRRTKIEIFKAVLYPLKTLDSSSVFVSIEIMDIHRASFVDFVHLLLVNSV